MKTIFWEFGNILYFCFPWVVKGFKVDQWIGNSSYYPKVAFTTFSERFEQQSKRNPKKKFFDKNFYNKFLDKKFSPKISKK